MRIRRCASAETNFDTVLGMDSKNTAAQFGLVLCFTYEGLIELTEVLPKPFGSQIIPLITQSAIGRTRSLKGSAVRLPVVPRSRTRSSSVQSAQLQLATYTLPGLTQGRWRGARQRGKRPSRMAPRCNSACSGADRFGPSSSGFPMCTWSMRLPI